jgi:hypothetical protein
MKHILENYVVITEDLADMLEKNMNMNIEVMHVIPKETAEVLSKVGEHMNEFEPRGLVKKRGRRKERPVKKPVAFTRHLYFMIESNFIQNAEDNLRPSSAYLKFAKELRQHVKPGQKYLRKEVLDLMQRTHGYTRVQANSHMTHLRKRELITPLHTSDVK